MDRSVLLACWPWLVILVASAVVLRLLCRMSQARLDLARLLHVHRNQEGSVQSLSFVITLPFFIMVLMTIVQVSQMMIGTMVVEYAAYAAARCAIVTVPARISATGETENCIGIRTIISDTMPTREGPYGGGTTYLISDPSSQGEGWTYPNCQSAKFQRIAMAAALACVPISPSASRGASTSTSALSTLISVYTSAASQSAASATAISQRLSNKLAYAVNNTAVQIQFYHKNANCYPNGVWNPGAWRWPVPLESPTGTWLKPPDPNEYVLNEMDWQDVITVRVRHNMALLPGPYATLVQTLGFGSDKIQQTSGGYSYTITAEATLGNEGQKSKYSYEFYIY